MVWLPKRFTTTRTTARDWYTMILELGERVVRDIRTENPIGRFPR